MSTDIQNLTDRTGRDHGDETTAFFGALGLFSLAIVFVSANVQLVIPVAEQFFSAESAAPLIASLGMTFGVM